MAACFQSALVTKELRNGSRAMPSAPSPPRSRQHRPRSLASDQTSAMLSPTEATVDPPPRGS